MLSRTHVLTRNYRGPTDIMAETDAGIDPQTAADATITMTTATATDDEME